MGLIWLISTSIVIYEKILRTEKGADLMHLDFNSNLRKDLAGLKKGLIWFISTLIVIYEK
jgi:hypothetical protein